MQQKIGIIGLWHLGCVLTASWSKLSNKVYGFDYDNDRIKNLVKGIPPLFEPNLEEELKESIKKGLVEFSNSIETLKCCDYIFLSYDTPVNDDDTSDTTILERAVLDVRNIMMDGAVLIVSSQSPVGYCYHLRNLLKEVNRNLDIAYSPENLRLGEAIECYLHPGRIILGVPDDKTEQKCVELFNQITDNVLTMNLESSEMVKHGINSFLSMSIVYANHIADICEEKGAMIDDVIKGIKSDVRIGQRAYLSPGIGFSGGTLGRDLKVLDSVNVSSNGFAKLFGTIHELNGERKFAILKKTEKILNGIEGKTVGILGLTYKPGTSTLRRSLPLEIVDLFLSKKAKIKVYDPKADYTELDYKPSYEISNNIEEVAKNSDILILLTEWEEFKTYDWLSVINSMNKKIFYDTKNVLNGSQMKNYGFNYFSTGR